MHQLLMHGLAVAALTSLGVGPAPAPAQVRLRGTGWAKGPKRGQRDLPRAVQESGIPTSHFGTLRVQHLGGPSPAQCSPLGFGALCGGWSPSWDSSDPVQALGQRFSPAGKSPDPLEAQPRRRGLALNHPPRTRTVLDISSPGGSSAAPGAGPGRGTAWHCPPAPAVPPAQGRPGPGPACPDGSRADRTGSSHGGSVPPVGPPPPCPQRPRSHPAAPGAFCGTEPGQGSSRG